MPVKMTDAFLNLSAGTIIFPSFLSVHYYIVFFNKYSLMDTNIIKINCSQQYKYQLE